MFRLSICVSFLIVKLSEVLFWDHGLQSEYVSVRDKRRQFVSGFTGSAGRFNTQIWDLYSTEFLYSILNVNLKKGNLD